MNTIIHQYYSINVSTLQYINELNGAYKLLHWCINVIIFTLCIVDTFKNRTNFIKMITWSTQNKLHSKTMRLVNLQNELCLEALLFGGKPSISNEHG